MTELEMYAVELARPVFCEVVLSRFISTVRIRCKSRQEVDSLYKEWRTGKMPPRKLKIVQE